MMAACCPGQQRASRAALRSSLVKRPVTAQELEEAGGAGARVPGERVAVRFAFENLHGTLNLVGGEVLLDEAAPLGHVARLVSGVGAVDVVEFG
jgi:hypothetical protein